MRQRGFTLVELLVAIGILAMVAVLGWRGLDGIVRARVVLTEQMETTRGMQLAFAQMQSDCEHVAGPDIMDQRPFLLADPGRLTLVRVVSTENQPTLLQVVAYRVVDGKLVRKESNGTRDLAQLDGMWRAYTTDADTSPGVALQAGVTGMQVALWQNNQWRAGVQVTQAQGSALPQQVQNALNQNGQSPDPTGVQVALTAHDQKVPMTKSFLLGGAL
jgi:general secretion pathway protein J